MTKIPPRKSAQHQRLAETSRSMLEKAAEQGKQASEAFETAKGAMGKAGDAASQVGGEISAGTGALVDSSYELAQSAGQAVKGSFHAGMGTVAKATESVGSAFGFALEGIGKAFLSLGNKSRELADVGGTQYTTETVKGDRFAEKWSDTLFAKSSRSFSAARKSLEKSIDDIQAGGDHFKQADRGMWTATVNLGNAAKHTLVAAVELNNEGSIALAEDAVQAATLAVAAKDKTLDAVGSALITAGESLFDLRNKTNHATSDDTLLRKQKQTRVQSKVATGTNKDAPELGERPAAAAANNEPIEYMDLSGFQQRDGGPAAIEIDADVSRTVAGDESSPTTVTAPGDVTTATAAEPAPVQVETRSVAAAVAGAAAAVNAYDAAADRAVAQHAADPQSAPETLFPVDEPERPAIQVETNTAETRTPSEESSDS